MRKISQFKLNSEQISSLLLIQIMKGILDGNDSEEIKQIINNLELVTLYNYDQYYILQAHRKATNISNNLIINKQNLQITEKHTTETIESNYISKHLFSAFMGIFTVLNRNFLFFVDTCEKVCTIEGHDIFQVRQIKLIPCSSQQNTEFETQIQNYILYLKNYLLKQGYYFSFDYDLSLSRQDYAKGHPTKQKFHWNLNMCKKILQLNDKSWFVGLMQGSVKYFKVFLQGKKLLYYLITRRSWKLGGTRYNARGIDNKGYVANFCQVEQLISVGGYLFSHVQIRGSVPAFWKQTGIYAQVQFYSNHEQNRIAFQKHFKKLEQYYSNIFCLNLLSKQKSGQYSVTLYYQQLVKELSLKYLKYQFYDFHFACKGQKFQRSDYLINKISPVTKFFGYYTENTSDKMVIGLQKGVYRTNCLDCLDRTNLVQSKIAYDVLGSILVKCGFNLNNIIGKDTILNATHSSESNNMFIINIKNIWADNGDAISKHYTGTGSTHTNVTRTGRRDLKGVMDHGLKTLGRFYKQYMVDNYKQQVIDLIICEHTETINLAEFDARLKNAKQEELQSQQFAQF